jgi:hypothetical protein
MEALEPRLALTWAGVPPLSITPPTNAVSVTLNSQGDATGTASIATTEVDYYSFTATSSGSYMISATTPSSNLDTVIGVFSASGQRLSYNDDISGTNYDSRLTVNLSAGSTYFLGVTNYSINSRGAYSYTIDLGTITAPTDDAYENNDTLATAYNLGTLSATRTISSLRLVDSADWYRFTTTAAGTSASSVSISFTNSQGNLQLALFNAAGTQLSSSQGTGNSETLSLNGLAAATYFVRVTGASGATNPNYTLSINPPAAVTQPTPVTSGFTITLAMSGLTANQQSIFNQAAARWSQIIVGDLPNANYRGQTVDDVLIAASAVSIDGVNGILGQAAADALRSGSQLPYHGYMQFDTADLASLESRGQLFSVIMHEMGHVLGIGTIWSRLGLLSGAGTNNPLFVGAQATAAYNQVFGTSASGVPVENSGGGGTRDAHWRETIFRTELMTGYLNSGANPLSRITIASLADMGYSVNLAAADAFTRPAGVSTALVQPSSGVANSLAGASRLSFHFDTIQLGALSEPARSFGTSARSVWPEALPFFTPATPFCRDLEVVDSAVADATQELDSQQLEANTIVHEPGDAELELAWDDLGSMPRRGLLFALS